MISQKIKIDNGKLFTLTEAHLEQLTKTLSEEINIHDQVEIKNLKQVLIKTFIHNENEIINLNQIKKLVVNLMEENGYEKIDEKISNSLKKTFSNMEPNSKKNTKLLDDRVSFNENETGLVIPRHFTNENENVFDSVTWKFQNSEIKNPDGSIIFQLSDVEIPDFWSQTAIDVLSQKYFRKRGVPQKDAEGNLLKDGNNNTVLGSERSLKEVVKRLVGCWKYWGQKHGYFSTHKDANVFEDELTYMLINQMFAPNSPQWFNTGLNWAYGISGPAQGHWYTDPSTKKLVKSTDAYSHPQVHACFIQSVNDDLVNKGGIMDLFTREARIFKYGSGTGTNFSNLRSRGDSLSGGGFSSGVMSFLKIGDATAGSIKSGGTTRRAAKMVILDIDHPEIEDFINWKVKEEKKVSALMSNGFSSGMEGEAYQTVSGQNSNNSVRISNQFMKSLINDEDWELKTRSSSKPVKTLKAKEIWDQIAEAAWGCADPGIQYDTIINDWHTCPESGKINASNPCSEYMFLDDTACNLASINLGKFLDKTSQIFDVKSYKHAIRLITIVLEISVLMAQYPSKKIADLSFQFRTLGLGYSNLGSTLMNMGMPYDSDEAREFAAVLTAILTGESYSTSSEMASFLGPFPRYDDNSKHMLRVIRNHRRVVYDANPNQYEKLSIIVPGINQGKCPPYLLKSAMEVWDKALNLGENFGYRNAQSTCIAPTGTISLVMDCDTTGIEPDFALVKFKKLIGGGYFKIINQSVPFSLKNMGYSQEQINDVLNYVIGTNTFDNAPFINTITLKNRGLSESDIKKIESLLPTAYSLSSVFDKNILGDECLRKLGIDVKSHSSDTDTLKKIGFKEREIKIANEYICGSQSIEGAPHLKKEHYPVFDCANKCGENGNRFIDQMAHVKMMAATQPFITGSISKTINMPEEATIDEIKDVYLESWRLGLKSIAIYRDNSKLAQPLSTSLKTDSLSNNKPVRKRLPSERDAIAHKFKVGNQEGYIHVGLYDDGSPGEVFIRMAKEGSTISGLMDSFAVALSLALQYGVPLNAFVNKFIHTRFEPMGWTDNSNIPVAKSIMDYLFRWLELKFISKKNDYQSNTGFKEHTLIENENNVEIEKIESKSIDNSQIYYADAPTCHECGSIMRRAGTCYLCTTCGTTSGCS